MFIASQKKKENIAEYVLYMWQIEDVIRAYKLDIDLIKENIVSKFQLDKAKEKELTDWYDSLIEMMRSENVQETGHLQINKNTIIDLTDLHKQLVFSQKYPEYTASFYQALPFIAELKTKQTQDLNDIEVALNFMYGILMLKLQHKDITEGTQKALEVITRFLIQLSSKYKQYKEDTLKLDLD